MSIGPSEACHATLKTRFLKLLAVPSNSRLLQKVEERLYEPDVNISIAAGETFCIVPLDDYSTPHPGYAFRLSTQLPQ